MANLEKIILVSDPDTLIEVPWDKGADPEYIQEANIEVTPSGNTIYDTAAQNAPWQQYGY